MPTCRYPHCKRDAVGRCVGCLEPVCERHASVHWIVKPFMYWETAKGGLGLPSEPVAAAAVAKEV